MPIDQDIMDSFISRIVRHGWRVISVTDNNKIIAVVKDTYKEEDYLRIKRTDLIIAPSTTGLIKLCNKLHKKYPNIIFEIESSV